MPASAPIRVGVFDIGMVLLSFDFSRAAARLAPRCTLPVARMADALWADGLVDAYDRGRVSCDNFSAEAARRLGFSGTSGELLEAWVDIFEPNPAMFARVRRWKARGLPLYLLSNTCESHVRFFTGHWDIFREFDGAVYSCRVGALKPEPSIYHALFEGHGVDPQEAIYLDDLPANVAAARALGMRAFEYRNEEKILGPLRSLGLD